MKKRRYTATEDELEQLLMELETSRTTMEEATGRFNRASEQLERFTTLLERKLEPFLDASLMLAIHEAAAVPAPKNGEPSPTSSEPALMGAAAPTSHPAPSGAPPTAPRATLFDEFDYLRLIGHDLKEPLRGILWFTQNLLEEQFGVLSSESRDSLEYIHSAARRAQRLLDDVLALAELRQRTPVLQENALQLLLNAAQARVRAIPGGEQLQLVQPQQLPTLVCDRELIEDCFFQLLRNAVQYSTAPAHVTVEWSRGTDLLELRFRDRGIGIPAAYLESIFGLFQRLHSWETHEGTGAGLTFVRLMMALQGGTVHASSVVGRGSTFVLRLPVRTLPREDEPTS